MGRAEPSRAGPDESGTWCAAGARRCAPAGGPRGHHGQLLGGGERGPVGWILLLLLLQRGVAFVGQDTGSRAAGGSRKVFVRSSSSVCRVLIGAAPGEREAGGEGEREGAVPPNSWLLWLCPGRNSEPPSCSGAARAVRSRTGSRRSLGSLERQGMEGGSGAAALPPSPAPTGGSSPAGRGQRGRRCGACPASCCL